MGPPPFGDGNLLPFGGATERDVPSMGPSPFGDGNWTNGTPSRSRHWRFNGAIAFQRWKRAEPRKRSLLNRSLQWGHRLSAMETGVAILGSNRSRPPSMGPSPFSDGNTPRFRPSWLYPSPFNGATAFQRWKLQTSSLGDWASIGPSMGPPPFSDGNLAWTSGPFQSSFLQWGHCLSAMETALCGSPPSWIHEKRSFPQESVTG